MGVYRYDDPQTGEGYDLNTVGEAPTDEEFARLAAQLRQDRAAFAERYAERFGEYEAPDDGTALGRGYERGKKQVKQAFGETLGTAGEASGLGFLEKYGTGLEERARQELGELSLVQPERMQSTDVKGFGTGATYLGELAGEQVTQLGLGLGAAAVGTALAPAAPFIAGTAAAALASAPILFGNNVQRQEDEVAAGTKASVDLGAALTATFGQSLLEGVSDKLLLGGVFKPLGKSLFTRTAGRFAGGAGTESLTEVGQQMMERAQAGLPVDSEEAIAEYREAAIAGGLIGGGVRATGLGERGDTTPVIPEDQITAEQRAAELDEAAAAAVLADTETAPTVEPEQLELNLEDPLLQPELRPGQEQGELFTTAGEAMPTTAAQAVERRPELLTMSDEEFAAYDPKATIAGPSIKNDFAVPSDDVYFDIAELRKQNKVVEPTVELPTDAPKPTVITKEMLDDIGVSRQAAMRKRIIGLDLTDETVKTELSKYANNPNPKVKAKAEKINAGIAALLGGADAGLGITPTDINAGLGDGVQSSGPSLEQPKRGDGTRGNTTDAASSDEGSVGDDLRNVSGDAVSAELGAGTLAGDFSGPAIWANADFDMPITVVDEPAQAAPNGVLFKKVLSDEGTESFVPLAELRAVNKPSGITPNAVADLAQEVDAIVKKPITPVQGGAARQLIPGTKVPVDKQTLQATGKPRLVDDPMYAPAPRPAPEPEAAAADPYAAMMGAQDSSQAVLAVEAQQALDARFFAEDKKLLARAREFHESKEGKALFETSETDPTTAADKEAILALLATPAARLNKNKEAQGAVAFFSKYRRPDVALAQIGALSRTGFGKNEVAAKNVETNEEAFYLDQTKPKAIAAKAWIEANLSPEANSLVKTYSELYGKDTSQAILSDKVRLENREQATDQRDAARDYDQKKQVRDFRILNDDKAILDDGVEFFDDSIAGMDVDSFMFLVDPVQGLNQQLLPDSINGLRNNNIKAVLLSIAGTNPVPRVRDIARSLAEVVGTTQVQVNDDLSQTVGRKAAGLFDPETNTISIDATNGMNVHTVMHEMTHAATSAAVQNLSLPQTKQLQSILNAVREQFGEVYGTGNLDEFVAEAFSNPQFQSALAMTKVDNFAMNGLKKFFLAVRNIVRKIMGLQPKAMESSLDKVDRIINGMLSPSPETRDAPALLLAAGTPEGSVNLAQSSIDAVPPSKRAEYVERASDVVYNTGEPILRGAKNVILGSLDSRILADVAKKKIPFAPELNVLIRKMSGAMRRRTDSLDAMVSNYANWTRKKENKAAVKLLNNIIPKSTALRIDPSLPIEFYSDYKAAYTDLVAKKSIVKNFKSDAARETWVKAFNAKQDNAKTTKAQNMKDPKPEDLVAYRALRDQYNAMGSEGQAFYRQMRNFFQDTYDEILPALRARLEATIKDPTTRASAFEKLQEILMKESGIIRPYFPLMRKGKHRLQYDFIDENGQRDQAIEYYQNRRSLDRAFKAAQQKIAVDVAAGKLEESVTPHYTRADQPMKFDKVPSSSFVYDILKQMEFSKGSFRDKNGNPDNKAYEEAVQSVVDLALDAMPERSFMQGFRRRKDVRGYIGDTTPTKVGDTEFDALSMIKEKGRDLNRQIVQIQAAAEIEKFRIKLKDGGFLENPETADIARKLDQIAAFAQKPNVPRWSQVANGVGFNMTMGLNFSSAAITFFDVAMSAMPIISAEYGIGKTAAAYKTATSLFAKAPRTRGVMVSGPDGAPIEQEVNMGIVGKSQFNYTKDQLPPEMQKIRFDVLIDMANDQGQANQSMTQESLEIGRDAPLEGINKWTSAMFHHSERFNRETTLAASYMLEVQKLQGQGKQLTDQDYRDAAQKAIETTEFTLGSTAAAGRPVWAQSGVGNVLFLFKRFAIAKYYMMYKLGHESIGTTKLDKIMQEQGVTQEQAQQIVADRKLARVGLRNFLITTGIMAGAGGMPMMGALGMIYNMFADDDEDDFEAALRKFTGEGIYGGLSNELLGIDVANRISLNSLLYRPPLIDKDQSPLWTFAEQIGGPVLGISLSAIRGGGEVWQGLADGDMKAVKRGAETVVPAAIRNVSKGVRFYTEGATTRRGDPITEDINAYNSIMQGLGFAPQAYIQQLEFNKNARRRQEAVGSERSKLLRRHNMAKKVSDGDEVQKVLQLIQEYNAGLPEGAQKSRITGDTIKRSLRQFGKTTEKMRGGMTYTDFMEKILEEYDRGFQGM